MARLFLALVCVWAWLGPTTSSAQRRRLPAGAQILRYGQGIHGVGSPQGLHFAYWGQRGLEVYDVVAQRRVRVDDAPELGVVTCAAMGWAVDGRQVAFTHERGVAEYDLDTGRVRSIYTEPEDPYGRSEFCAVAYDVNGRAVWTRANRNGTALFRERGDPLAFPAGFGAGRFALLAFGPTSGARHLVVVNRDSGRATRVDLSLADARFELLPGAFPSPYADRAGRRLCHWADGQLRCQDLRTGAVVELGEGAVVGTIEANPFSASGDRMVFRRGEDVVVHDFVAGRQRTISSLALPGGSFAYRGIAFEGEERVLFFEHAQVRNQRGPAITRIDLRTGSSRVLLRDEQQHCYAEVVGPETIFVFRTNRGGGEDLTRVHFPSVR